MHHEVADSQNINVAITHIRFLVALCSHPFLLYAFVRQSLICFMSLLISLNSLEFHINRIMYYVLFCVMLLSLPSLFIAEYCLHFAYSFSH